MSVGGGGGESRVDSGVMQGGESGIVDGGFDGGQSEEEAGAWDGGEAKVLDGGLEADAGEAGKGQEEARRECETELDCDPPRPVCSEVYHVCVECFDDKHCLDDVRQQCTGANDLEKRCVECDATDQCAGGVCNSENECQPCIVAESVLQNEGCSEERPRCKENDPGDAQDNTCEECVADVDCAEGVCVGNECEECDEEDDRGCETGVCLEKECEECDPADNRGCGGAAALCRAGETQAGNRCVSCVTNAECKTAANPHCVQAEENEQENGVCGGCVNSGECARFEETPNCETGSGECVECVSNEQCAGEARASRCDVGSNGSNTCVGCEEDGDCGLVAGKGACDPASQVCVECTSGNESACEGVCDTRPGNTQNTCTGLNAGSAGACLECVSDSHCPSGQRCVMNTFDGTEVGYYCLWKEGDPQGPASCFADQAPYLGRRVNVESVDGDVGTYCVLRNTTCAGFGDYSSQSCNSDADCGEPGLDDGMCEAYGTNTNRCTYQCGSNEDCLPGVACNTSPLMGNPYCGFVECYNSGDCPGDETCNTQTGMCE